MHGGTRWRRAAPAQPAPVPSSPSQPAAVVPLPRPHDGAVTLPGHGRTLLRQVRRAQEEAARRGRTSVLVALSVGNATEIADVLGAEVLGMEGRLGRIAPEAFADLLVVEGNPLRDVSCLLGQGEHIPMVMKAGKAEVDRLGG